MRKELFGIILSFLLIFILCSLFSYSPKDPSINHVVTGVEIHNLFGLLGAWVSDILIEIFGLGAFWIPVLLLFPSINFFCNKPSPNFFLIISGGFLIVVSTGSLFAIKQNNYLLFGNIFSSGGITGIPLKIFLVKYFNFPGATLILLFLLFIGLNLSTNFSFKLFIVNCIKGFAFLLKKTVSFFIIFVIQRKKIEAGKLIKKKGNSNDEKIKIKSSGIDEQTVIDADVKNKSAQKPAASDLKSKSGFTLPPVTLLDEFEAMSDSVNDKKLLVQSDVLEKKLADFGVKGKVVAVSPGPVITTFEYEPASGIKINRIVNLSDDLALALRAISIRIVAPIPGKPVVGIEIPNTSREIVKFKEIICSKDFKKKKPGLLLCMGKDIVGTSVVVDLAQMPHLLIAGATGTGKSVGLNAMICSLLYRGTPDNIKFIMVDPKRIELSVYNGIPHLITPVVTDVKKATNALFWAVKEMERRYELLAEKKCRNIKQYNIEILKKDNSPKDGNIKELPYIIIVIDELADLMMVASRDVELALTRLAQMARASGIHLILATQRPSVDVLTGIIKANFPTRLTFQVSSRVDSRTIIDSNGAESLLGNGDMLLLPPGTAKLQRIHGAYISDTEIVKLTDFLKEQKKPEYDKFVVSTQDGTESNTEKQEYDERYDDAVALVTKMNQASISMIQRRLRIGYNRAARIIEMMEQEGIVGPSDGAKPRKILVRGYNELD